MKSQWPTPTVALTPLKIFIPVLSIKLSLPNVTHTHTRFLFFFSMHGNSRPWCWIIGPPLLPSAGGLYGLAQGRPKKENTPTKRMKWKERYFSFSSSSSPSWMESIWIYCASKASDFQWENNEHTVRLFFFISKFIAPYHQNNCILSDKASIPLRRTYFVWIDFSWIIYFVQWNQLYNGQRISVVS